MVLNRSGRLAFPTPIVQRSYAVPARPVGREKAHVERVRRVDSPAIQEDFVGAKDSRRRGGPVRSEMRRSPADRSTLSFAEDMNVLLLPAARRLVNTLLYVVVDTCCRSRSETAGRARPAVDRDASP